MGDGDADDGGLWLWRRGLRLWLGAWVRLAGGAGGGGRCGLGSGHGWADTSALLRRLCADGGKELANWFFGPWSGLAFRNDCEIRASRPSDRRKSYRTHYAPTCLAAPAAKSARLASKPAHFPPV